MKWMLWELSLPIAQAVNPGEPLSTDLRWLRLPQGTQETVTMFFAVLVAVVLAVVVTLLVQDWVQKLLGRLPRRVRKARAEALSRLEPEFREALTKLVPFASIQPPADLVQDANSFEQAVAGYVSRAPFQEDLSVFSRLRRRLALTVMNPAARVSSTRQLLADLTVRLVASVGPDRLDLYCPILEVNERHLLIDVPYHKEIFDVLARHPDVFLLYWREHDGEAAFRVHLTPIEAGRISAFRCEHALRSEEAAARQDFRLTVDLPVTYQFVDRQSLIQRKSDARDVVAVRGEARLVDLSDGGAALLCDHPLSEHGFAQLHFTLRDPQLKGGTIQERPVRVMMEVLTVTPAQNGKSLARGHFRGAAPEARSVIHTFLTHEQFRRIQLREQVVVRTASTTEAAAQPAEAPAPAPAGDAAPKAGASPRRARR